MKLRWVIFKHIYLFIKLQTLLFPFCKDRAQHLKKDLYLFFINRQKIWGNPFEKNVLGGCIQYIPIPWLTEGRKISWSFPRLFFSCLMYVFFLHAFFSHGQPAELQVCISGLRGVSLLGWQNSVAIFFSPINLNNMSKKFSRRQRYVPALLWLISVIEGRNIVGLGGMPTSRSVSVGENKVVIKKSC